MRSLVLAMFTLIFATSSANAFYCEGFDVSNDEIQKDLTMIGDEIDDFNHSDLAKKFAFKRLRRVNKKLGGALVAVPKPVEDQDIIDLLAMVSDTVEAFESNTDIKERKRIRKLLITRRILAAIKRVLTKKRIEEDPNDVALLEISGSEPEFIGTTTAGSPLGAVFTVTNNGSQPATAISVGGLDNLWSIGSTDCEGAPLNPGDSCTVSIAYFPLVPSALDEDVLEVSYDNSLASDVASRTIQSAAN